TLRRTPIRVRRNKFSLPCSGGRVARESNAAGTAASTVALQRRSLVANLHFERDRKRAAKLQIGLRNATRKSAASASSRVSLGVMICAKKVERNVRLLANDPTVVRHWRDVKKLSRS